MEYPFIILNANRPEQAQSQDLLRSGTDIQLLKMANMKELHKRTSRPIYSYSEANPINRLWQQESQLNLSPWALALLPGGLQLPKVLSCQLQLNRLHYHRFHHHPGRAPFAHVVATSSGIDRRPHRHK